jgi:hypothetical protein
MFCNVSTWGFVVGQIWYNSLIAFMFQVGNLAS